MARPRQFDEDRVISAAMETFWRQGYEGTSTRDLCESTGLGPSSLYNSFGGKRQLYLRALERYYETATTEQVELLAGPGPGQERLRALMAHAIDADVPPGGDGGADGPRGCFAISAAIEAAALDPDVRKVVRRTFDRVEDAIHTIVVEGQAAGEFRTGTDARTLARQVLSSYYGLRVLARVHEERDLLFATALATLDSLRAH
ncbi:MULTISPECIES: TetR/AcrR family transcriptional regulator [Streptomyces]|uniref:TetR/AcrR family transcriptional regulator n=1 Tax=Streptomyces nondiastaticus TaxID=3154512 RepID=A0ABW6U707_9ACTN|nr:TetR/AcrR family transcriptional regulator [Streptomyces sp. VNUA116]WKU42765.1 TetR/AcrR family transcriptional regulator [Streptomyces sp. VNUA116]